MNNIFLDACFRKPTASTPAWYMRQAGRALPEYRALKEKYDILTLARTPELAAEVCLMPIKRFNVDAAILFADIMLPLLGMGVDLQIVESIGPVIAKPIRTASDLSSLHPLDADTDFEYLKKTIQILRGELEVPLIGFSGAPFTLASYMIEGQPSREFSKTKHLMHAQPDVWAGLMQALTDAVIFYLQLQIKAGVQAVQLFDSWVGVLSKDDYVKFALPYSQQIFEAIKTAGVPRIHFGTGTAAFLEEFSNVDCEVVGVDWRLSISEAQGKIGRNKAIQGNLDPAILLCEFDIIKERVDAIFNSLPDASARQGFIFNLGHGVLPQTPYENLIKLTEYVHSK